jgi:hypothetical protein
MSFFSCKEDHAIAYDVILKNGNVIDLETGIVSVKDIFIKDGIIEKLVIPNDLLLFYLKHVTGENFNALKYEQLQFILKAAVNLYGYCSIAQLVKLYDQRSDFSVTKKEVMEYVNGYCYFHNKILYDEQQEYVFHTSVSEEDDIDIFNN